MKKVVPIQERKIHSSSKIKSPPESIFNSKFILTEENKSISNSPHKDKVSTLYNLWEETNVRASYRKIFSLHLSSDNGESIIDYEISTLTKVKEKLTKLNNEISAREKSIELLKQFDRILEEKHNIQINFNKLQQDIAKTLQHLRVLTVNVVNQFIDYRKTLSYSGEKFSSEDLSYITEVMHDTDFLSDSNLTKFFSFSKNDPFLLHLETKMENNGGTKMNQTSTKIEEEMLSVINRCYCVILELNFISEIKSENKKDNFDILGQENILLGKSIGNVRKHNELRPLKVKNKMSINTSLQNDYYNINTQNNHMTNQSHHYKSVINPTINPSPLRRVSQSKENGQLNNLIKGESTNTPHNKDLNNFKKNTPMKINKDKFDNSKLNKSNTNNADMKLNSDLSLDKTPKYTNKKIELKNKQTSKEVNESSYNNTLQSLNMKSGDSKKVSDKKLQTMSNVINCPDFNKINSNNNEQHTFESETNNKDCNVQVDLKISSEKKKDDDEDKTAELLRKMEEALQFSTSEVLPSEMIAKEISQDKLTNSTNQVDFNNQDISLLKFEFLQGDLYDFQKDYSTYLQHINEELKVTFKVDTSILSYLKGSFPKIIKFCISSCLVGLGIIYFDNNKLLLTHLSTIYYDRLSEVVEAFISFLKETLEFDELVVELHHGLKNDSFYLNEKIKLMFTSQLGFKWLTLENTGTERKTKYKLPNTNKRPNSKIECLSFLNVAAVQLKEENNQVDSGSVSVWEKEVNLFPLTCILGEMIYNYDYAITNQQFNNLKVEKLRKNTKSFVKVTAANPRNINKFIKEELQGEEEDGEYAEYNNLFNFVNDSFTFCSLMKVTSKFESITSVSYKDLVYNRIVGDVDVLKHSQTGNLYYLIKCENDNLSILIGEVNENKKEKDLVKNHFNHFVEIYSKLEQNPVCTKKTIFLPSFSLTHNFTLANPEVMNDIKISLDENPTSVDNLYYQSEIAFKSDKLPLFKIEPNRESDLVIENDFLIGLINLDVLSEVNIPLVFVSLVQKENFELLN